MSNDRMNYMSKRNLRFLRLLRLVWSTEPPLLVVVVVVAAWLIPNKKISKNLERGTFLHGLFFYCPRFGLSVGRMVGESLLG